jgi:hypothetical protein
MRLKKMDLVVVFSILSILARLSVSETASITGLVLALLMALIAAPSYQSSVP